ncbi:MBL fold metallo-hydrolase [Polaromonas jejuensis]|uniref:MBL fold metallo-hydrolase n=1 Tax=Polaromonas jejuensis TaxID=457502 RepID=A0ABW0QJR2_9BURK|nr:MBL fold metallo-hydrolase [Polaromonas jejuensis]
MSNAIASGLHVETFFDPATSTFSYLLLDPLSRACALIDPVWDFDIASGRCSTASADLLLQRVKELNAQVEWILETHVHADHLSASDYLRRHTGGRVAIGKQVTVVQAVFSKRLGQSLGDDEQRFDHLFTDDEAFCIGTVEARAWHTPGHTPACVTYVVGDAVFVGDTLFMPDCGTARCDFPGGDARALYASIQRILGLPPHMRLYVCHDYPPDGRVAIACTTVAAQRAGNIHVGHGIGEDVFIQMRRARDATLATPKLFWPALQVNIRGGRLPPTEVNGVRYLRLPVSLGG